MTSIITSIIAMFASLFDKLMPVYDINSSYYSTISSSITTVADFVKQANFIIPLPDIIAMVGIDLGIRIFKIAAFSVNWVIRRLGDVIP